MPELILPILPAIRVFFNRRASVAFEALVLRRQAAAHQRKRACSRLNRMDLLFRIARHRVWSRWTGVRLP